MKAQTRTVAEQEYPPRGYEFEVSFVFSSVTPPISSPPQVVNLIHSFVVNGTASLIFGLFFYSQKKSLHSLSDLLGLYGRPHCKVSFIIVVFCRQTQRSLLTDTINDGIFNRQYEPYHFQSTTEWGELYERQTLLLTWLWLWWGANLAAVRRWEGI